MDAKLTLSMLVFLLILPLNAISATVSGNVYDYSLQPVNSVIIEVNSSPRQMIVAIDGNYNLGLEDGVYTLTATQKVDGRVLASTTEEIAIQGDGIYILDLVLFPNLELDEYNETAIEIDFAIEKKTDWLVIAFTLLAFVALGLVFYYAYQARKTLKQAEKPTEMEELFKTEDEVLKLLKDRGGSLTQKEIRKQIPMSEAKISLVISGLEAEDKVKKLRVGRGNIIKLTK